MNQIMFSIITVTYNSEKTICDTLESVLNQTYTNYEYIIIDGKSKDNTINIIKEYEEKFQGKLRYISESDNGIYDAMNKGIKMAKGDLIGIINSDDWYEKDALKNIIDSYKNCIYSIYYGYMRTIDDKNGKEIRCTINMHEYIKDAMINHPTVFVSKQVYEEFGMYDCRYKASADYDFIIRMVREEKIDFIPIYRVQANFRTGGVSSSVDALKETMWIKKKYGYITNIQYIASIIYLQGRKLLGYSTM